MFSRPAAAMALTVCLTAATVLPIHAEEGASTGEAPQLFAPPESVVPFAASPDVAIKTTMVMVSYCVQNDVGSYCVEHEIPSFSLVRVAQPPALPPG